MRLKDSFTDILIRVLDNQGLLFRQRLLIPCMYVQQSSCSQQMDQGDAKALDPRFRESHPAVS